MRRPDVEIVLVSRDNFFLMYPLLFEVCSGTLEMRHCCVPIRAFLRTARFVEATVHRIDLDRRVVHTAALEGEAYDLPYDQLVLALGAMTNEKVIPGSESAFTFKTLADAVVLRNHLIERFERADVEADPERKRRLLTIVVIGGGLVGVELFGELTAFVDEIIQFYGHVCRDEVRFLLLQAVDRIMPEIDPELADYATRVLAARPRGGGPDERPGASRRAGEGSPEGRDDRSRDHRPGGRDRAEPRRRRPAGGEGSAGAHHRRCDHAVQEPPGVVGPGRLRVRPGPRRQALPRPGPARPARGEGAGPQYPRRPERQAARAVRLPHHGPHGVAGAQERGWPKS